MFFFLSFHSTARPEFYRGSTLDAMEMEEEGKKKEKGKLGVFLFLVVVVVLRHVAGL